MSNFQSTYRQTFMPNKAVSCYQIFQRHFSTIQNSISKNFNQKRRVNPNAQMFRTIFFLFLALNSLLFQYLRCTPAKFLLLKIISFSDLKMLTSFILLLLLLFYLSIYFFWEVIYFLILADKNLQKREFTPPIIIKRRPSNIFEISMS